MEYYLAFKNEWSSDPGNKMNEFWKYYAKWNKLHTKGQILYMIPTIEDTQTG